MAGPEVSFKSCSRRRSNQGMENGDALLLSVLLAAPRRCPPPCYGTILRAPTTSCWVPIKSR
eukprot:scaffold79758_cov60-Attheya_sp.AAC.1